MQWSQRIAAQSQRPLVDYMNDNIFCSMGRDIFEENSTDRWKRTTLKQTGSFSLSTRISPQEHYFTEVSATLKLH